jgi:beta-mannosidase
MSGLTALRGRRPIDGPWQVATAPAGSTPDDIAHLAWIDARVPGTLAGAMRRVGTWTFDTPFDFDGCDAWWRTRIDVEAPGPMVLGFDGLATLADVWIDGTHVLRSENMFAPRHVRFDATGSHDILIRCAALTPELERRRPRPRWRVPMLKATQLRWFRTTLLGRTPGWSPSCPPVGPWRPVWIARGERPDAPRMIAKLENDVGHIDVEVSLDDDVDSVVLVAEHAGHRSTVALDRNDGAFRGVLRIDAPALWWPHTHGDPALYDVSLEANRKGVVERIALGRTGFRTVRVVQDDGDFAVHVNDVSVFCRGACWTPLDVVDLQTPADACRAAIAQVRNAGMNMLRVAGTMVYEDDAFYDALDEHGILLWQDFMFANMDYPEDDAFVREALVEVDAEIERLRAHPCLALFCGNSEGEQQAAMSGAPREAWSQRLFSETIAARVAAAGHAYVPSSTHGGAFPHAANAGPSSYYGVGAYLRPLDDARRSELRFASECLAFANIPADDALPGGPGVRAHHAAWKARSPRDLGAGWDFDDVRDHYVARLYGVDPAALRYSDHDRYLALGRAATGEVMAAAFSEWRRRRSPTRGALILFLRDLWPGAGWGIVDANGTPKACYYAVRRALAPLAVAISDEGVNGLVVHAFNDGPRDASGSIELALYRGGEVEVIKASRAVSVPAHGAIEIPATDFLEGFYDLSFAYRFGPPTADLVHAVLHDGERVVVDAFSFPIGLPSQRELDVGLAVQALPLGDSGERIVEVSTRRFAQNVTIDAPGFDADDNGFHLAPGQARRIVLRERADRRRAYARYAVSALNSEKSARFEIV